MSDTALLMAHHLSSCSLGLLGLAFPVVFRIYTGMSIVRDGIVLHPLLPLIPASNL